jgi:hypothetical protein
MSFVTPESRQRPASTGTGFIVGFGSDNRARNWPLRQAAEGRRRMNIVGIKPLMVAIAG